MTRSRAGFTLLEVFLAVSIMAMVLGAMYATLETNRRTRDQIATDVLVARFGPTLLDRIESDLERLWVADIADDRVFKAESRVVNGQPADTLLFLTTVDSTTTMPTDEGRLVTADVCETGYRLRRNPRFEDYLELWRRQDYHVDDEPYEDGVYELLHDRVVSFDLRFLEFLREDEQEYEVWDASKRHRLPAAVILELELEVLPPTTDPSRVAAARTLRYRRVIPIGEDRQLALRVHPRLPDFVPGGRGGVDGSGTGGASGGSRGADGEEGEGEEGADGGQDQPPTDPGDGFQGGDPPPSDQLDDIMQEIFGAGGGG